MSNTIERYESVIFPVPNWTKWWRHKWVWYFPDHYFLQFCLDTITSSWYPPSIIKTHKITKWGKKITKWGKKNLKEAQVLQSGAKLQSGASFPQPSLWSSAHVWWNFFTKIVNCLQPLTVFAKTLLHRYLAGSKIRFWSLFNHKTLISSSPENIRKNLVNETFLQVTNTNKNNR